MRALLSKLYEIKVQTVLQQGTASCFYRHFGHLSQFCQVLLSENNWCAGLAYAEPFGQPFAHRRWSQVMFCLAALLSRLRVSAQYVCCMIRPPRRLPRTEFSDQVDQTMHGQIMRERICATSGSHMTGIGTKSAGLARCHTRTPGTHLALGLRSEID